MSRVSTRFLQALTVLLGIAVLVLLLWEPRIEGRNANASTAAIYLHDPFLAYVYLGSIPFFVALYSVVRLLNWIGSPDAFSRRTIEAARLIRICARTTIGFILGAVVYLLVFGEERPPAIFIGSIAVVGFLAVASSAAVFEKLLERAADLKHENDLTV